MSLSQNELPVEWVTKDDIRRVFNQGDYYGRTTTGEIITRLVRNSHLNPTPKGEPYCTQSQILYYYTKQDALIAVVHQYLRPSGEIGGSGLPDPKRIVLHNKIIAIRANS